MTTATETRRQRIRRLRRKGLSASEVAEVCNVSRVTVWRHCRGMEDEEMEGSSAPPPPMPSGRLIDWPHGVTQEVVEILRGRAHEGSISAAHRLGQLALAAQRGSDFCSGHIDKATSDELMQGQFEVWLQHMRGPFLRRVALEFGVDLQRLGDMVEDAAEDVQRDINARRQSEIEAKGGNENG